MNEKFAEATAIVIYASTGRMGADKTSDPGGLVLIDYKRWILEETQTSVTLAGL